MKKINSTLKGCANYVIDFFMSVLIGLGIVILLTIPLKFVRVINMDIASFLLHLLSLCVVLYIRSYHRGYHTNTQIYTFQPKKAILFVSIVFAIQAVLVLIIGGHAVYITGPTVWFSNYILPPADRTIAEGRLMIIGYDWLFMLLADIFIYALIMVLGEYFGDKQNRKELSAAQNDEG